MKVSGTQRRPGGDWRPDVLSAVVGCRKDGNERALVPELVAVLDDHVRPADEVHVKSRKELVDLAEQRARRGVRGKRVAGGEE